MEKSINNWQETRMKEICHQWFGVIYHRVYRRVPHEETAQEIALNVFDELRKETIEPYDLKKWLFDKVDSLS